MELKGIAGKVPAWVALWSSSVESRFEAMSANRLTALVGREEDPNCFFGVGPRQGTVKVSWYCFPVRQVSESRGSRPHYSIALPRSHLRLLYF